MTALSAAAMALFAHGLVNGDEINHGAGFEAEAYVGGNDFDPSKGDDGVSEQGTRYWYTASADAQTLVISNYTGETLPAVPDIFANDSSNAKYLHLDTSSPLFRSAKPNAQSTAFEGVGIGDGIYLDTLVKFTAADAPFEADLTDGDKIAIEYVDQTTDDTIDDPIKGFVIRAGRTVGEDFGQANYFAAAPADFDVSAWHRLTVRSIADVGDGQVGFVIYLDGDVNNPLAYDTEFDAGFGTLDKAVAEKFYNNSLHALYPSAVDSQGTGGSEISAVSFSGTGCIDDVVFTTTTPNFIQQGESVVVSFVADAGVTAISVEVKGVVVTNIAVTAAGTYAATLEAQTTAFTVNVTADEANGYTFGGITVGETDYDTNPASVTGYNNGDAITVTTVRNNFTYLDANDQEQTAGTLTDAFAGVKVGGTITMNYTYNLSDYEGLPTQGTTVFSLTKSCVLDLNGKTLNGGSSNDFYLFTPDYDCEFTVIDSATGGKIVYGGTKGIFNGNQGDVFIGSITLTDNGPTIDGSLMGAEGFVTSVWRGKFSADENTEAGQFVATSRLGDVQKCKAELDANEEYWVVTYDSGEEPPAPTTYELTIPTVTGASATVTDKATSSVIADLTAIEDGTVVTVTWTADSGYKITAGATEEITMDEDKTADEPTVVAITYATLTITPVENCTIVVSNATEEVATGATFDVDDAVELTVYRTPAEGYELDNCAATEVITMSQNQTVTAAVKQSGGGSDYPTYIEDITDPTEKAAYEKKYDTWATTYSVADGAGKEEAFLLNCAPADVETAKANFKIPSITVDAEGNVTVGTIEGTFNGKLQLKGSTDLKNWTNLNAASKDYNFFKYELTY